MSIKQYRYGSDTEKKFKELMTGLGWWVHQFTPTVRGTPCDFVVAKDNEIWFVDVKNVHNSSLMGFGRLEENQINAFKLLTMTGNWRCGWVLHFDDGFYFFSYLDYVRMFKEGYYIITKENLLPWLIFIGEENYEDYRK
jgi:hypothetical protein